MKSLHIRDVPEPTIARLKRRALLHHRSLQGELIFVLEEAAKQIPHEEPAEDVVEPGIRFGGVGLGPRVLIYAPVPRSLSVQWMTRPKPSRSATEKWIPKSKIAGTHPYPDSAQPFQEANAPAP